MMSEKEHQSISPPGWLPAQLLLSLSVISLILSSSQSTITVTERSILKFLSDDLITLNFWFNNNREDPVTGVVIKNVPEEAVFILKDIFSSCNKLHFNRGCFLCCTIGYVMIEMAIKYPCESQYDVLSGVL
jgi:hypothetical protein